jgi:hypothetical protein
MPAEGITMRWIGVALIVLGIVGLIVGGFTVTKDETKVDLGPIKVQAETKERFPVPPWVSIVAIGAGLALVAMDLRRKR